VELTSEELQEYEYMTRKMALQYFKSKNQEEKQKTFDLLCIQRQKIVIDAMNKFEEFKKILGEISPINYCLIYCSPKQIDTVQEILLNTNIIQHKFTAKENLSERERILEDFANGMYMALVAMRCLDEGVDVPQAKSAVIMASSGNPKEFIQRRGRILRRFQGKEKAIVHDIIVVPTIRGDLDDKLLELERRVLQKELRRYLEFAEASDNYAETLNILMPIFNKYKLRWGG
jgi:superfamily II DNA or RNA helicase